MDKIFLVFLPFLGHCANWNGSPEEEEEETQFAQFCMQNDDDKLYTTFLDTPSFSFFNASFKTNTTIIIILTSEPINKIYA